MNRSPFLSFIILGLICLFGFWLLQCEKNSTDDANATDDVDDDSDGGFVPDQIGQWREDNPCRLAGGIEANPEYEWVTETVYQSANTLSGELVFQGSKPIVLLYEEIYSYEKDNYESRTYIAEPDENGDWQMNWLDPSDDWRICALTLNVSPDGVIHLLINGPPPLHALELCHWQDESLTDCDPITDVWTEYNKMHLAFDQNSEPGIFYESPGNGYTTYLYKNNGKWYGEYLVYGMAGGGPFFDKDNVPHGAWGTYHFWRIGMNHWTYEKLHSPYAEADHKAYLEFIDYNNQLLLTTTTQDPFTHYLGMGPDASSIIWELIPFPNNPESQRLFVHSQQVDKNGKMSQVAFYSYCQDCERNFLCWGRREELGLWRWEYVGNTLGVWEIWDYKLDENGNPGIIFIPYSNDENNFTSLVLARRLPRDK